MVPSDGNDWLLQLPIVISVGTGGTADVEDSAVIRTFQCSAAAAAGFTESIVVIAIKLWLTAPSQ